MGLLLTLTEEEQAYLHGMLSSGKEGVRKLTRARILLKADESWADKALCEAFDVSASTVERVRRRFVEQGLETALNRRPTTRRYERKLDGQAEAHLMR
jgi:transposase